MMLYSVVHCRRREIRVVRRFGGQKKPSLTGIPPGDVEVGPRIRYWYLIGVPNHWIRLARRIKQRHRHVKVIDFMGRPTAGI